jgi:hypothetical protein
LQVAALVERVGEDLVVRFEVTGVPAAANAPLLLHWCASEPPLYAPFTCAFHRSLSFFISFPFVPTRGLYREAAETWQQLPTLPEGSAFDAPTGGTRTPLKAALSPAALPSPSPLSPLRAEIRVPAAFAPASLGFTLYSAVAGGTHLGRTGGGAAEAPLAIPFCVPLGHAPGSPAPLGASLAHRATATGVTSPAAVINFAVHSRAAASLVLYLQWDGGELELALDPRLNRTGDVWHVALPLGGAGAVLPAPAAASGAGGGSSLLYGYRAAGGASESGAARGERFLPARVLFDPYAAALCAPAFAPAAPAGVVPPPLLGDLSHLTQPQHDWESDAPPVRQPIRARSALA